LDKQSAEVNMAVTWDNGAFRAKIRGGMQVTLI
jgi:hypothetical protein